MSNLGMAYPMLTEDGRQVIWQANCEDENYVALEMLTPDELYELRSNVADLLLEVGRVAQLLQDFKPTGKQWCPGVRLGVKREGGIGWGAMSLTNQHVVDALAPGVLDAMYKVVIEWPNHITEVFCEGVCKDCAKRAVALFENDHYTEARYEELMKEDEHASD